MDYADDNVIAAPVETESGRDPRLSIRLDRDPTARQMFGWRVIAPFAASASFGLIVTSWCMSVGNIIYTRSSSSQPYEDTGFTVAPDYTSWCYAINTFLALLHFFLFVSFCFLHVRRLTLARRFFLVWGVVQLLELAQFTVTRFPDPSVPMRARGGRVYAMHPVQYVCLPLFVQYYAAQVWPKLLFWAFSAFAWAMLVPTHMYYTVDCLCAVFVSVFVFMMYHWYVRTVSSIQKRPFLIHLEYDVVHGVADEVLHARSFFRKLNWFNLKDQKYEAAVYAAVDGRGPSAASRAYLRQSQPQLSGLTSPRSSLSDFRMDFSERGNALVQELILRAEELCAVDTQPLVASETPTAADGVRDDPVRNRRKVAVFSPMRHQVTVTGLFLLFGASIGFLNLVSVHIADVHRPIHVPIADDVLFSLLPLVPEHTADFCLYPLVVIVLGFSVASPWRFVLLRRTGLVYGFSMLFRLFTVPATFAPDPSANCVERSHAPGTTCGDLIYSGHTISFLMAAFAVRYYSRNRTVERLLWALAAFGLLAIVSSRLHYTRDVFTSVIVVLSTNHFFRVAIFKRVDRITKYKILEWFERDAYLLLAEETNSRREGRLSTYDWIGRCVAFWRNRSGDQRAAAAAASAVAAIDEETPQSRGMEEPNPTLMADLAGPTTVPFGSASTATATTENGTVEGRCEIADAASCS